MERKIDQADGPRRVVELRIPCRPEYVAVARLTVSGVASRLSFSYEDIEDIKIAVAEACTGIIQGSKDAQEAQDIGIVCSLYPEKLLIEVLDEKSRFRPAEAETFESGGDAGLGILLIESLVDDVCFVPREDGATVVRMTKNLAR